MSVEIIAEIGENHLGDMSMAKAMVAWAAANGIDTVKFQSYNEACIREDDPERDWFLKVALSNEDHFMLKEEADKRGVKFLSSPFSIERADFLIHKLGMKEIKVASCMMYEKKFIQYLASQKLDRIYLSTGMAHIAEILEVTSMLNCLCFVMHCISLYPAPPEEADLSNIRLIKNFFPYCAGYSDHTIGIDACLAAVAMGAVVIEKHFTLDKKCEVGTDHTISCDPADLNVLIRKVRLLETMLDRKDEKSEVWYSAKRSMRGRFKI